jgi:cytochrome c biogenesis protein CcmG, thiol:disulfide interchange protein DsbE
MRSGVTILAGLLAGVLSALGILAALVFVGPDPVGLRPTPSPSAAASLVAVASPSLSPSPAAPASAAPGSGAPSGSAGLGGSAAPSDASQAGFHVGETAPPLVVSQLGGGTIDLATLRGKAVWLNFMQTTRPESVDDFPVMNDFKARYEEKGLVVMAVDIREDEAKVAAFAVRLNVTFPIGLDGDGTAQQAWGTYALPIHFWIDKEGIIRAGALGGVGRDIFAANLGKVMPGVTITP